MDSLAIPPDPRTIELAGDIVAIVYMCAHALRKSHWTPAVLRPKIEPVGTSGESSPSEERARSVDVLDALALVAAGLPEGWVASIEWNGQTRIHPARGALYSFGDLAASPDGRRGKITFSARYSLRPRRGATHRT